MAKIKMTPEQEAIVEYAERGIRNLREPDENDILEVRVFQFSQEKATKEVNISRTVRRDGHSGENGRMDWRTEIWRVDPKGKISRL